MDDVSAVKHHLLVQSISVGNRIVLQSRSYLGFEYRLGGLRIGHFKMVDFVSDLLEHSGGIFLATMLSRRMSGSHSSVYSLRVIDHRYGALNLKAACLEKEPLWPRRGMSLSRVLYLERLQMVSQCTE